MRIAIAIPPSHQIGTGNSRTAQQWAELLGGLGHELTVLDGGTGFDGEVLVALHALKSRPAVLDYRRRVPGGKVILCLTGTDLYGASPEELAAPMGDADRLLVLQSKALERVPTEFQSKTRVLVQGVEPSRSRSGAGGDQKACFTVCVVGHLREVKDPLRAAAAARLLPTESRVEVLQAGAILEEKYQDLVAREERENPRYRWLGELDYEAVRDLVARSELMVLSSYAEGGARVVGEAVVDGTPVLSSRIDGVLGLLGERYPGYYPAGDTRALAALMWKAESEEGFREELREGIARAAPQFDPSRVKEGWESLLCEIDLP